MSGEVKAVLRTVIYAGDVQVGETSSPSLWSNALSFILNEAKFKAGVEVEAMRGLTTDSKEPRDE